MAKNCVAYLSIRFPVVFFGIHVNVRLRRIGIDSNHYIK